MKQKILEKLEWPLLLERLASYCQTEEAQNTAKLMKPDLGQAAIAANWQTVVPLRDLAQQGYRAPVGSLSPVTAILKAAGIGQILEGKDLRAVFHLLEATHHITQFALDLAPRCPPLARLRELIHPLPALAKAIDKAIDAEGGLNDEASPELADIRRQKRTLSRRIEQKLKEILSDPNWDLYLQDDFFTVRNERYVVPIKLDGRGRVAGTICDTSDSGQTLFIEPASVAPLNQALQELDLSEKLEIIRIFRVLTRHVAEERSAIAANYDELVRLDLLSAQAELAVALVAGPIELTSEPSVIELRGARHPLVTSPRGERVVPNDIALDQAQSILIISGPNAGGKTVVLKTVGMLLVMAKAGLLLPADERSRLSLYAELFLEMGDAQSLTASLSTFSGHIEGLKPIVSEAGEADLVLLDELAVGTEPQTGAAIAQAVLEHLVAKRVTALVTTHYDNLKGLAVGDGRFRNASMEYSLSTFKPTYRLILDVPGQSYGLEVAEQTGLPHSIIARAESLRGKGVSSLDEAVSQLMRVREATEASRRAMLDAQQAAAAEKARWEHEVDLLKKTRQNVAEKLKAKYEKELAEYKESFAELNAKMQSTFREARKRRPGELEEQHEAILAERSEAKSKLRDYQDTLAELNRQFQNPERLPGRRVPAGEIFAGHRVYVVPLKQEGRVVRLTQGGSDKLEVEVGTLKLKLTAKELRLLGSDISAKDLQKKNRHVHPMGPESVGGTLPVIQTSTNTLDLRGLEVDEALARTWKFIDTAVLRGDPHVILVHGHGTAALKGAIRHALGENCPYDLKFQPGERSLGGDGVTVVTFGR